MPLQLKWEGCPCGNPVSTDGPYCESCAVRWHMKGLLAMICPDCHSVGWLTLREMKRGDVVRSIDLAHPQTMEHPTAGSLFYWPCHQAYVSATSDGMIE